MYFNKYILIFIYIFTLYFSVQSKHDSDEKEKRKKMLEIIYFLNIKERQKTNFFSLNKKINNVEPLDLE